MHTVVRQWDAERNEWVRVSERVDRVTTSSLPPSNERVCRSICSTPPYSPFSRDLSSPSVFTHAHTRTHIWRVCLHVYLISLDLLSSPVRQPPARPVYSRTHTSSEPASFVAPTVVYSYIILLIHGRILYKSGMARKTTHVWPWIKGEKKLSFRRLWCYTKVVRGCTFFYTLYFCSTRVITRTRCYIWSIAIGKRSSISDHCLYNISFNKYILHNIISIAFVFMGSRV